MKNPFFGYYVSYESEAVWSAIYSNTEIQRRSKIQTNPLSNQESARGH